MPEEHKTQVQKLNTTVGFYYNYVAVPQWVVITVFMICNFCYKECITNTWAFVSVRIPKVELVGQMMCV